MNLELQIKNQILKGVLNQKFKIAFHAKSYLWLIDLMLKFVIPLRFQQECISFGSIGQKSLRTLTPMSNPIERNANFKMSLTLILDKKYISTHLCFRLIFYTHTGCSQPKSIVIIYFFFWRTFRLRGLKWLNLHKKQGAMLWTKKSIILFFYFFLAANFFWKRT